MQWNGPDIVVFSDVYIRAPYKIENVSGGKTQQLEYVKKLVMNHRQQQMNTNNNNSSASSEVSLKN